MTTAKKCIAEAKNMYEICKQTGKSIPAKLNRQFSEGLPNFK